MKKGNELIQEMIEKQRAKLQDLAQIYHPTITSEDLLQINDFPTLENNPLFRYEEGILAGMQMIESALQAIERSS